MCVYVIAQISINDRPLYKKYQAGFLEVFQQFKGQLLAADEEPQVVEGVWEKDKVVLLKFPDKESFEDRAFSPEYQEIAKDRWASSFATVLLVKSFNL